MATAIPVVGSKIYIGDKAWTHDTLAEYDGQAANDWIELGIMESWTEFGDQTAISTINVVSTGRVMKVKTFTDSGDITITFVADLSDDGQVELESARADMASDYPIKVVMPDDPGGVGSKPTRFYFRALVAGNRFGPGAPDALRRTVQLAINTEVLAGEAVEGT